MTDADHSEPDVEVELSTPTIKHLVAALAKFQGAMPTVEKSKTANVRTKDGGSYSYKYADLADVTRAAMPLLAEQGLAFICIPEEGGRGFLLRGVLAHESGERIEGFLPIYGTDNQSIGGSLSYGRRYLLGALTGIVTDEDTDAQGVGGERTTKAPARQRAQKPPAQPPTPATPPEPAPDADPSWADKIADAATFDELTAVYNEADSLGIFGHMLGGETVKSRLYARRNELTAKDAQ